MKKLNKPKKIFSYRLWIVSKFSYLCDTFYFTLFRKLTTYVAVNDILKVKKIIRKILYYLMLSFRVWNHIFFCLRSQYKSNMCLFCTKIYLRNKKVSRLIETKLTVDVLNYFPVQISHGTITDGHVNLFVHSSVNDRQKLFDKNSNFGTLSFEVINFPFLLWKFYLDVLARMVFNYCDKYILPTLLSDLTDNYRNYTTCTRFNCYNMKKNNVKENIKIIKATC